MSPASHREVVTTRNGPKVNSLPPASAMSRCASGCMLENPSIRSLLAALRGSAPRCAAVTMRSVRTISREVGHESDLTPQRPHAGHPKWVVRWSHLHGDM